MKLKEFLDMYDNWNSILKVNDNNLDCIVKDKAVTVLETRKDLYEKEVVAFGFYDGELCVRVKDVHMNNIDCTVALRQYEEYRAEYENAGLGACSFDTWLEVYEPELRANIENSIKDANKIIWQREPEVKEVTMEEVEEKFGCKVKIVK